MRSVADTRMSMSGWTRWKACMCGINHIDANDAKVLRFTTLRPRAWRIWRTLASMRCNSGATLRSNKMPSDVSST